MVTARKEKARAEGLSAQAAVCFFSDLTDLCLQIRQLHVSYLSLPIYTSSLICMIEYSISMNGAFTPFF